MQPNRSIDSCKPRAPVNAISRGMRFFISKLAVTIIPGVLCAPDSSVSQTNNGTLTLPRLQGRIELDGMSDETAWQEITPLPLTIHLPVYGKAPSERANRDQNRLR